MGQVIPAVPPNLTKNVLSALIPIYEPALVTGAEYPLTATCRLTLTVYRGLDLPLFTRLSVTLGSPFISGSAAASQQTAALCESKVTDYLLFFNSLSY